MTRMQTSTPASPAPANPTTPNPDETEALLKALYEKDAERGYATSLVDGRVCLIIRPASGDRFVLPLPAPYRGTYCTTVEDLLKLDLAGPPLLQVDQPCERRAVGLHSGQLHDLANVLEEVANFINPLFHTEHDAPHLIQATIHGVTLHWPRIDGGRIELEFTTLSLRTYPVDVTAPYTKNGIELTARVTLRGQPTRVKSYELAKLTRSEREALADELKIPRTPALPEKS